MRRKYVRDICTSVVKKVLQPDPLRALSLHLAQKYKLGDLQWRIEIGATPRPSYYYCTWQAAILGKMLGYDKISVVEFGVAGGNGLVALERAADEIAKRIGIDIQVYGFDTGAGLPPPKDYRDLPYHWKAGFYKMDQAKLGQRLRRAKLVIGNIESTAREFFKKYRPAPIGAVIQDFDYYSSTAASLKLFDKNFKHFLPRVFCYFDDTIGSEIELYNDFTGERLAINEFNQNHDEVKLAHAYHLLSRPHTEQWHHQIWICHIFKHSKYNRFISYDNQQMPLRVESKQF